ncbi:MAG: histidine kinase [Roseateles sp.]
MSSESGAAASTAIGPFAPWRRLWRDWRSLSRSEFMGLMLLALGFGLIDLSALVDLGGYIDIGEDPRWLAALCRQLLLPVIVTLLMMLCVLPTLNRQPDHPQRLLRLALATLISTLLTQLALRGLVGVLDWPSVDELLKAQKGESKRPTSPTLGFLGQTLQIFILAMLAVALIEWQRRRRRAEANLARLQHEQQQLARRALAHRLAALQAQIEPEFLFDALVEIERAYAQGRLEAAPQMENLIHHLRVALPRLREPHVTPAHEAELLQSYLAVLAGLGPQQQAEVLQFSHHCPEPLRDTPLPPMLLLPLLQRALRKAAPRLPRRCSFTLEALEDGRGLRLLLALDLPGLCGDDAELQALGERLRTLAGGPAELRCRSSEDATLFTLELRS